MDGTHSINIFNPRVIIKYYFIARIRILVLISTNHDPQRSVHHLTLIFCEKKIGQKSLNWLLRRRTLKIFLYIFLFKIRPSIVAPPYHKGSWFQQLCVYPSLGCFHTLFFRPAGFWKEDLKKKQFLNNSFLSPLRVWSFI